MAFGKIHTLLTEKEDKQYLTPTGMQQLRP